MMIVFNPKNYLLGRKSKLITLFVMFFSVLYLYSYREVNIPEDLFFYTDKYCHVNDECIVNMKNITPFEWDYMYVINSGYERKEVESAINLKIDVDLDNFSKIIFVRDNKLVHLEHYFYVSDFEKALLLNFDVKKKEKKPIEYYVISKDDADVLMKKEEDTDNRSDKRSFYWFSYANENQVVRID
ncbi:hypothetical protein [Xenorhabdus hominickii]|uniref:Uncharacterized protein n=1 Tax=Xenorhabdus hominickii TaxID=351679 RepID=A0A2G0PN64_XENHO|nr:hypothetical protein [Xenorhabdus hominickii]AOM39266.1 hypothetical protein A9255_00720 [Xenorhabdus hominickii]PHM48382.1 hypothetical protein Xhom_05036 [Xenorhabdus hominickii]